MQTGPTHLTVVATIFHWCIFRAVTDASTLTNLSSMPHDTRQCHLPARIYHHTSVAESLPCHVIETTRRRCITWNVVPTETVHKSLKLMYTFKNDAFKKKTTQMRHCHSIDWSWVFAEGSRSCEIFIRISHEYPTDDEDLRSLPRGVG